MSLDLIRTGLLTRVKSVSGSGGAAVNGGVISIPLNKTFLTERFYCDVQIAQAFTGVPTSSDVRRAFKSVALVADKGDGVKLNFHAAYDLARVVDVQLQSYVTLAASSTARFGFELNGLNENAIGGLISAWLCGKYSSLELKFELNPDANTCFIGGTVPQAATYQVDVYPYEYRDMTPQQDRGATSGGWGVVEHSGVMLSTMLGNVSGLTTASQVGLKSGNKTRFLMLHAFDAASFGNLTDAPFLNGATVSLNIDGKTIYNNTSLAAIKDENASRRNFSQVGALLLDAGDDPLGWWDLRAVKDQKVEFAFPASANYPAAWRIEVAQDYTRGLELLQGYPVAPALRA